MNDAEFAVLRTRVYEDVRQLSLSSFIERELNVKPIKSGKSLRFSACPNCGKGPKGSVRLAVLSGDTHYKCHRCEDKGDIIDAATKLWGKTNWECALQLTGRSSEPAPQVDKRIITPYVEDDEADLAKAAALREALTKIQKVTESFQDEEACLDYLTIERDLPLELLKEAQRRKMLGFLPSDPKLARKVLIDAVGEDLLKASGLWGEGKKASAIFWRPIVFFLPGFYSAEFRILGEPENDFPKSIRYGTAKLPYVWKAAQPSTRGMVVEGFIDLLSSVALGYKGNVIGLPGCNNWEPEWFQYLSNRLNIDRWIVALDNDSDELDDEESLASGELKNPGQTWADRLQAALDELEMENVRHAPPPHYDINRILQEKKAA